MPHSDLSYRFLADLKDQHSKDANKFGAKAANLGEIYNAKIPDVIVPDGFSVPFVYYQEFVQKNNLKPQIIAALKAKNSETKKKLLQKLRADFLKFPIDQKLAADILQKVHTQYPEVGLFIRSSTNAEDLPGFSGAGLYDTVANVSYQQQGDAVLLKAIQKVWSSVWNDAAVAARESAGIEGEDHLQIYASVLLQVAINADCAGVLITTNPYKINEPNTVYINAKRGLGIKVVEGKEIPEQILYRKKSGAIIVLSRSADNGMLVFAKEGGIKEVATPPNLMVLNDHKIKKLVKAAKNIERLFGKSLVQDIEWLMVNDQLYIVQSRPF